jgi:ketosteroid isomerase-like protein
MRRLLWAAVIFASLGIAAPALAGDKETIQSLDDQFSALAAKGDDDALAAMYAPGATVLPPDNAVVTGPGIRALFAGMGTVLTDLKLTATDVTRLSPDYIREVGVSTYTTRGAKPVNVAASYVVVWRKVDGVWKLWTDIFH